MTGGGVQFWFSAAELAALALPGVPRDKRQVNVVAKAEGWAEKAAADGSPLCRKRSARGGGIEYHSDLLPDAARRKLAGGVVKQEADAPTVDQRHARWHWFERLPKAKRQIAEDRLAAVLDFERRIAHGFGRSIAAHDAAQAAGYDKKSLRRWVSAIRNVPSADWLPFLAPNYDGGRPPMTLDDGAWLALKSNYLRPEKPSWSECYRRTVEQYAKPRGITLPDETTLRRVVEQDSAKAHDVHNMQKAVIQEAIDKIGLEVTAAQAGLSAAQVERENAWKPFVIAAHLYLGERLRREFEALRINVIEPMLALQCEGSSDRSSLTWQAPRLVGDFEIIMRVREDYEALELRNSPMPVPAPPIKEAGDTTRTDAAEPQMAKVTKTRWHDERLFPVRSRKGEWSVDPIDHLRLQLASE